MKENVMNLNMQKKNINKDFQISMWKFCMAK